MKSLDSSSRGRRGPESYGRGSSRRCDFSQNSSYSKSSSVRKSLSLGFLKKDAVKFITESMTSCFRPNISRENGEVQSRKFRSSSVSSESSRSESRCHKRGSYLTSHNSSQTELGDFKLTIQDILKATRNFAPSCKIGEGTFGTVYLGKLVDGTCVAIKRAKKSHDNHLTAEFQNEIKILAGIEHLNLVKLYDFLQYADEKIIVVEYVSNGTLREHLDGLIRDTLSFTSRLNIAIDVAHAITYLHMYTDNPIIHRDIKASNILLTENLRAKVADFGFARLAENDMGATHVTTKIMGTAGYVDPEYIVTYQLSEKSDVYSFGVLLVELMSGRRPIESQRGPKERMTPKWAINNFLQGDAIAVLDPKLGRDAATNVALEGILKLASNCLKPTKNERPSMKRCGEILWDIRKTYNESSYSSVPASPLIFK